MSAPKRPTRRVGRRTPPNADGGREVQRPPLSGGADAPAARDLQGGEADELRARRLRNADEQREDPPLALQEPEHR